MSDEVVHKNIRSIKTLINKVGKARVIAIALVSFGFILITWIFLPLFLVRLEYQLSKNENLRLFEDTDSVWKQNRGKDQAEIAETKDLFEDEEFSIIIPKIGASSKVIEDVDPFNEAIYTAALTKGIAHAKGTSYPSDIGNTFLFAHSATDFYDLVKQNVNFYLLTELEDGDEVYIMYKGEIIKYEVVSNIIVEPEAIEYLTTGANHGKLTLMTCWPAGTDLKRVIVEAKRI